MIVSRAYTVDQEIFVVVLSIDDACHTNEMIVYHEASRSIVCVDLTKPIGHDPIDVDAESDFVGPSQVR